MSINILIGRSLPRLLSDIMRTLVRDEPGIRLQAQGLNSEEILARLRLNETDVVIVGCDRMTMDECGQRFFAHNTRTRVIAVAATDCNAVLYSLTPVSQPLGQLCAESLLDAIRQNGPKQRVEG